MTGERVREFEAAWLMTPKGERGDVPGVVRATWFMASVLQNDVRYIRPMLRKAGKETATVEDVRHALEEAERYFTGWAGSARELLKEVINDEGA